METHATDPQHPPSLSQHFRWLLNLFNVPFFCVAVIEEHALRGGYDNIGAVPAGLGTVHPDPRGC